MTPATSTEAAPTTTNNIVVVLQDTGVATIQHGDSFQTIPSGLPGYIAFLHAKLEATEKDREAELQQTDIRVAANATTIRRLETENERLSFDSGWKDMVIDATKTAVAHEKGINRRLVRELETACQGNDQLEKFEELQKLANEMEEHIGQQNVELTKLKEENEKVKISESGYKEALENLTQMFCNLNESHDRQDAAGENVATESRIRERTIRSQRSLLALNDGHLATIQLEMKDLKRTIKSQQTRLSMAEAFIAKLEVHQTTTTPPQTPPSSDQSRLRSSDISPITAQTTVNEDDTPRRADRTNPQNVDVYSWLATVFSDDLAKDEQEDEYEKGESQRRRTKLRKTMRVPSAS